MSGPVHSAVGRRSGTRAGIDWNRQPLGQMTDQDLARRLGVNVGSVQQARVGRGIPRFDRSLAARLSLTDDLGVASDREIAERIGVSPNTIAHARMRRGIAPVSGPRREWDLVPLGQTWDREIAERLGCSPTSVADARRVRGIPPYRERRECGCGRSYVAYTREQTGCSRLCCQIAVNHRTEGKPPALAPLSQALAALRRDVRDQMKGR